MSNGSSLLNSLFANLPSTAGTQSPYSEPLSAIPTLASVLSTSSQNRQNLYYRSKKIYIDGYTFKNCRFDDCNLITKRGTFQFIECVFDDSTVVSYEGPAANIIKLYNRKDQKRSAGLLPQINPNGTITIKSDLSLFKKT